MHVVTPKAFMVASTSIWSGGLHSALEAMGAGDWGLDLEASDAEILIEVAGRLCYKSFGLELNKNLTKVREGNKGYLRNLMDQKHGSTYMHPTVTFILVDVSRVLTHELVRHMAGTAYSHESGRFVRLDDIGMYIPDTFSPEWLERLHPHVISEEGVGPATQTAKDWAKNRSESLKQGFAQIVNKLEDWYQTQIELLGMNNPKMPFQLKKTLTSALRRIAPEGRSNNIMFSANHRALRYMCEVRTSNMDKGVVEEEIGKIFVEIGRQLKEAFPNIYQDMTVTTAGCIFENSKI